MVLATPSIAGLFNGTVTFPDSIPWDQGYLPRGRGQESFSPQEALADHLCIITTALIGPDENWGTGEGILADSQHNDYHYRLWVLPPVLQLTNPQLGTNIPFRLWNTWYNDETITDVNVTGSEVLTFDVGPGFVLWGGQFAVANMQIGPGEPTVEATVEFLTENLRGTLQVIAAISDTFNLIPDVPVSETWEFKTNIIENYLGQEQRVALRRYPRIRQEFEVEIIDTRQRREQYLVLRKNIVTQSLISFYQFGVVVNGFTASGGLKIFCETKRSNFRIGEFAAVINTTTEALFLARVEVIEADGITLNSPTSFEVDGLSRTWIAIPCFTCLIEDGSGITMDTVSGTLSIKADTFIDPPLLRPGATRVIDTYDSIPWINRRHFAGAAEDFQYRREIIDGEVGVRRLESGDVHPKVFGNRKFLVQRGNDPDEMDYWRSLFDTVRGAQKSFLMSTFFPDLTLSPGQLPLTDAASTITFNEGTSLFLFTQYESWKRLDVTHPNGERTQHTITSSVLNIDGTFTVVISPAFPTGAQYQNPKMFSFLMRVRATDRIVWEHFANYSEVSFGFITSDE